MKATFKLRLTQSITIQKGLPFTVTLRQSDDNRYEVLKFEGAST